MKNKKNGFTLIELMIVIIIIGILAAIAIPVYQDYVKRVHVSEGLILTAYPKFAIYEYYHWNNSFPTNNLAADLPTPESFTGTAVKSITVENGTLKITYNYNVLDNATILLVPSIINGDITWDCTTGTVSQKLRPAKCRTN